MEREVNIVAETISLPGTLTLPDKKSLGVVLFAHGSGSSRFSPRNRFVAEVLQKDGIGTLLFDLLTQHAPPTFSKSPAPWSRQPMPRPHGLNNI